MKLSEDMKSMSLLDNENSDGTSDAETRAGFTTGSSTLATTADDHDWRGYTTREVASANGPSVQVGHILAARKLFHMHACSLIKMDKTKLLATDWCLTASDISRLRTVLGLSDGQLQDASRSMGPSQVNDLKLSVLESAGSTTQYWAYPDFDPKGWRAVDGTILPDTEQRYNIGSGNESNSCAYDSMMFAATQLEIGRSVIEQMGPLWSALVEPHHHLARAILSVPVGNLRNQEYEGMVRSLRRRLSEVDGSAFPLDQYASVQVMAEVLFSGSPTFSWNSVHAEPQVGVLTSESNTRRSSCSITIGVAEGISIADQLESQLGSAHGWRILDRLPPVLQVVVESGIEMTSRDELAKLLSFREVAITHRKIRSLSTTTKYRLEGVITLRDNHFRVYWQRQRAASIRLYEGYEEDISSGRRGAVEVLPAKSFHDIKWNREQIQLMYLVMESEEEVHMHDESDEGLPSPSEQKSSMEPHHPSPANEMVSTDILPSLDSSTPSEDSTAVPDKHITLMKSPGFRAKVHHLWHSKKLWKESLYWCPATIWNEPETFRAFVNKHWSEDGRQSPRAEVSQQSMSRMLATRLTNVIFVKEYEVGEEFHVPGDEWIHQYPGYGADWASLAVPTIGDLKREIFKRPLGNIDHTDTPTRMLALQLWMARTFGISRSKIEQLESYLDKNKSFFSGRELWFRFACLCPLELFPVTSLTAMSKTLAGNSSLRWSSICGGSPSLSWHDIGSVGVRCDGMAVVRRSSNRNCPWYILRTGLHHDERDEENRPLLKEIPKVIQRHFSTGTRVACPGQNQQRAEHSSNQINPESSRRSKPKLPALVKQCAGPGCRGFRLIGTRVVLDRLPPILSLEFISEYCSIRVPVTATRESFEPILSISIDYFKAGCRRICRAQYKLHGLIYLDKRDIYNAVRFLEGDTTVMYEVELPSMKPPPKRSSKASQSTTSRGQLWDCDPPIKMEIRTIFWAREDAHNTEAECGLAEEETTELLPYVESSDNDDSDSEDSDGDDEESSLSSAEADGSEGESGE